MLESKRGRREEEEKGEETSLRPELPGKARALFVPLTADEARVELARRGMEEAKT